MAPQIRDVSDADVTALVGEIDRRGFGVIQDFIGEDDLARMRGFVASAVQRSNGEYAGFSGPEPVAGSGLEEMTGVRQFRDMVRRVYEIGTGAAPPQQEFYQVLRCLSGHTAKSHSYFFHYDSYVVTVLIPIVIPAHGQAGHLLLLPNVRRIRKSYFANVLDKIVLDNGLTQWMLRKFTDWGVIKLTRVEMVPGNAYVFWGYRTVHANEPCDPDQVRATALFHFANPHLNASLGGLRRRTPVPQVSLG